MYHIIELLKRDNKYRIYKNKFLAYEAGFGSTQTSQDHLNPVQEYPLATYVRN
ncbi:hypothetical protein [Flavobacterium sp. ZE23DGlu08]|uniref:hypothetical protein n=1 Tax=Flavobacterium sp. ZE23DGlu08 TaxID=3059026 RepID=UPI00265F097B|nr:hypothetical protein [Flavobacterium sp. ZE23DGlu08]WKL43901.1 hypothetical protein Q1W72_16375 [Flavobacterium sp. ZE23DGlu08]